ncbi:MAG: hypothetical protein M3N17_01850 [Actinomycetota bacterium]|nr:hypothetical protein [Actinomycetota bacterium]
MDDAAARIRELVLQAVAVAEAGPGVDTHRMLTGLRAELLALCEDTADTEATDAACGAVHELDAALDRMADGSGVDDGDSDYRLVS